MLFRLSTVRIILNKSCKSHQETFRDIKYNGYISFVIVREQRADGGKVAQQQHIYVI